ncbi:MAG: PorP/SprF family type IX secretion system membrane protein [Bacteroidetes bacterium]|nr:PorP/SprF family type IX secretion system membrane protein [Bacteroidota bacterium]
MKSLKSPLILAAFVLLALADKLHAQESSFSNFYNYNTQLFNPAFSGLKGNRVAATHRSLWMNIPGAPKINAVMADGFFTDKAGWGAAITDESFGIFKVNNFSGSFSYRMPLSPESSLSVGFSGFFQNTNILFNDIIAKSQEDPILLNGQLQGHIYNIGAGLVYQFKDLQIGLAIPRALAPTVEYSGNEVPVKMLHDRQVNTMAFYRIKTNNEKLSIKPSMMAQYDISNNNPLLIDGSVMLDYEGVGWAGVFVRNNAVIGLNLAFIAKEKLCIGYAFSFYTGQIKTYTGFNHEFLIGYKINDRKPSTIRVKGPKDPLDKIKDINELKRIMEYKERQIIIKIDEFYSSETKDKEKAKEEIEKIQKEIEEYRKQVNFHMDRLQK